jgi:dTDP-4-dehydrorhamnose reductase
MAHHILLIGGHGKIAQILTPLLLAKSWNVTSMIRTASQQPAIEKLGHGQPGKLQVLVNSVADVKSEGDAKSILEQVKPDWVVWSAGKYRLELLREENTFILTVLRGRRQGRRGDDVRSGP